MSGRGIDEAPSGSAAPREGKALLITVLALLGLGTFVLLFVGMFLTFVDVQEDPPFVLLVVQMMAGTIAVALAAGVGLLVVQSPSRAQAGPTPRPVRLLVFGGVAAAMGVLHAVAALIVGTPVLVVVGFLLGLGGMAAAGGILGHRARLASYRREHDRAGAAPGTAASPDLGWSPEVIRRKWRAVLLAFLIGLVATTAFAGVLALTTDEGLDETWAFIVQLSFLAAGITSLVVAFPAQLAAAPITRDLGIPDRKAINRRVFGKGGPLAPDLEWRAARVAAVTRTSQPFLMAQSGLVFVGVVVPSLFRGIFEGWFLLVFVALGVFLLAMTPYIVRSQRGLRRFAEATRELALSPHPVGASETAPR
ncbi:hypothetical protein ABID70_002196 [Clavibacter michiganensis]|uniref:hypothetical protein n=1 Tax=Clavibacter michiganensis TaxID=28447 RepID=UPI001D5C21A6|nr:hypothetical protein [Clavibacter michiganensis]MBP2456672.1 putative membrane channel-forming protein YqfA (hemolysin III family) [Clavibacter michiganensis]